MFDVTSRAFGGEGKLYRVSRGSTREIADLFAFESRVNPDGGITDTNPFDVEVLNEPVYLKGSDPLQPPRSIRPSACFAKRTASRPWTGAFSGQGQPPNCVR